MYVARDEMGTLFLYDKKPVRVKRSLPESQFDWGDYWASNDCIELDEHLFPELTWEQEPIEVELIKKS